MTIPPEAIAATTFVDLPQDQAVALAKETTSCHSLLSFQEPLTYGGYSDVHIHYIVCEKDLVIPPEIQAGFVDLLRSFAGDDKVTVHKLDTDHAPVASRFEDVTAIIKQAVSA